jgi:outer membrane protein TolC
MFRISLLASMLFVFGIGNLSAQSTLNLSLDEAIEYAKNNNRKVINADKSILAARYKKWETTAMGLPQINAKVDFNRWIKQQKQLLPASFLPDAPPGVDFIEVAFGTKQTVAASATLSQLIFDGQYLVGLQAAKVFLTISEQALEKTVQQIEKNVVSAYGNVLMAEELLKITERNIEVVNKSLFETEKMYENGLVEEENVEQLKVTQLTLINAKNNAKRMLTLSYNMLNFLLGNDIDVKVKATDELADLTEKNIKLHKPQRVYSLKDNIDIKIAENDLESQYLLKKQQLSKSLPRVSGFLNAGYNGNSDTFTFLKREQKWLGFAMAGLQLNIPIFSSLSRTRAVQRLQVEIDKKENDLEDVRTQTKLNLDKAVNDYNFSIANLKTSKQSLKLAERIESKNQIKYTEGVGSSFELRQAQQQLYKAQSDYINAMVNVINARAAIKAITNN